MEATAKPAIDPNVKELNAIPFSDAYLGSRTQIFKGVPGAVMDPVPAPTSVKPEIETLRTRCQDYFERHKDDFSDQSEYGFRLEHKERLYRVTRFKSMDDTLYVLRRFPMEVPIFSSIGMHPIMVERLMQRRLAGLVLVSGAFAQGKTTTASSYVDARLRTEGGVAITVEDPAEMPLEGARGDGGGVCYQTECRRGGFGDAVRMASRIAPDIIFLGEIRDSEAASEAIRAANNGRLIVATIHADQTSSAVERLYSFANGVAGSSEDVAATISRGLTAVVHQRLDALTLDKLTLIPQMLWLGSPTDDKNTVYEQARRLIHQRKWTELDGEVNRQAQQMIHARRIVPGQQGQN